MAKKLSLEQFTEIYKNEIKSAIDYLGGKMLLPLVQKIDSATKRGGKIVIIGNGGSASLASHIACDWGKGTIISEKDGNRMRIFSLVDNTSLITALGNDLGFENIFVEQLKGIFEKNDLLLVISGRGNSMNIVRAVEYAKKKKIVTFGLLGSDGGVVEKLLDNVIIVKSDHYGPIEDMTLIINHIIASWIAYNKSSRSINKATPFRV